jgi:phenylalanyl-tRNA synthetase alpha chain
MGAASWLASKGLVSIEEDVQKFFEISDPSVVEKGLPERRALSIIDSSGGKLDMNVLSEKMPDGEDKIAVGWLRRNGLADLAIEGETKCLALTDKGRSALKSKMDDEALLERMVSGPIAESEADPKLIKDLKGRQGMVRDKIVTDRTITLTGGGRQAVASGIELKEEVTDITDRLIQSGEWENVQFRKYDVGTFAPTVTPAKKHPLTRLGNEIRQLFTNMGFTEMSSEYVQPAFWNLDVLFTPQDHPARDLQDTFYLDSPSRLDLEDDDLVQKVKDIHEKGGNTGSTGWGGEWSREKAEAALLRTHSTVSSIRYIAEHPDTPQKAFSISRIFRKESIDSTHLPEFTQIEGIVIDENGNFNMLISMIKEFYSRMGFDQIRIRPAYFPYTEPSLELEVYFNGKWMELGGAGIFRPEVVEPFGVKHPVLAWGFGFERLAMLKWNIKDIRDLYISDMDDLKKNTVF